MANKKISELVAASSIDGTEYSEIIQGGVNKKVLKSTERTYFLDGAGLGTVTSVSVTTANGVSASISNPTTTPDITFTLGAITPTSVVASGNVSGLNLSGTNTGDQTITLTGEATGTGTGSFAVTLTNSAVIGKVLTGLSVTGSTIASTDTILQAFGKLQNQINGVLGGAIYQGTWNATTNSPSLATGVGTKGYYYIVSVAGSTNLDGITDWKVGDWAIYNGTAWNKVDNTDAVVTVNGYTGTVVLTTSDIAQGTNLYFTNAAAIGSTLTGYTSGAGTISSADSILSAIQKLNGNDALAWKVTGTSTLTGVATITSNAQNQHIFAGSWTATANNTFHVNFNPTITQLTSLATGFIASVVSITGTIIANNSNQILNGLLIKPTFTVNGQSNLTNSYIRCEDSGSIVRFQVTDSSITSAGSTTFTLFTGAAGPQLQANTGTLQLNANSGTGAVSLQVSGTSWFAVNANNSIGMLVQPVAGTVTSTATQQSSRNFNWVVNEWTGAVAQNNYWTAIATQSTATNQLNYWDLFYGVAAAVPSKANLYMRIRSTDGAILIGAGTSTTATPSARLTISGGTTTLAPLKLTSGTNLTTAENGAFEYNGTNIFFTRTGAVREGVLTQSAVTTEVIVSDTSVTVNIGGTVYKLLARA